MNKPTGNVIDVWLAVLQFGVVTNRIKFPGCEECERGNPVPHWGSRTCRSSGVAAPGGFRTHCTCDACW